MTQEAVERPQDPLVEDIVQRIQRDLNRLSEPTSDRVTKKRALDSISKESTKNGVLDDIQRTEAMLVALHKPLLRMLNDPVEKCREQALSILHQFYAKLANSMSFMSYLIPVLYDRLRNKSQNADDGPYGQQEPIEPSEEIRLRMVELLFVVVQQNGERIAPCAEDISEIVSKTLMDNYPDVKKVSCMLLVSLAKSAARQVAMQHTILTRALFSNFLHKHANVRSACLQAFGAVMMVDATALEESSNVDLLRRLSYDKSGSVRETLFKVVGNWLLHLRDRYGFAPKLLPIFLAGFSDELMAIQTYCNQTMDSIGAMYEYDYEQEVKDELDYCPAQPDRPRIGARRLFRDNTLKTVKALLDEAGSWTSEARLQGLKSLQSLFRFSEANITGYTDQIVPVLLKLLGDEDSAIRNACEATALKMARYVKTEVLLEVLRPVLTSTGTTSITKTHALILIKNWIQGFKMDQDIVKSLEPLLLVVTDRVLVESEQLELLSQVILCVQRLLEQFKAALDLQIIRGISSENSYLLFYGLLCIKTTVTKHTEVVQVAEQVFRTLASLQFPVSASSVEALYDCHTSTRLVPELLESLSTWNRYHPHLRLFKCIVHEHSVVLSETSPSSHLAWHQIIVPLAKSDVLVGDKPEPNTDLRFAVIEILADYFSRDVVVLSESLSHLLVQEIFVPNLIWKGGRKAEEVRRITIMLLENLVSKNRLSCSAIAGSFCHDRSSLLNVVNSCTDEDPVDTRKAAVHILRWWFEAQELKSAWNDEQIKAVYPELLKRLDDARDEVRLMAATAFRSFLGASGICPPSLDSVHYDAMLKGIAIHLDDINSELQTAIAEVLIACSQSNQGAVPEQQLREYLSSIQSRFRNQDLMGRVMNMI